MAKVTIDNLDDAIAGILEDFEDSVASNMQDIVSQVGKAGTDALKNKAKSLFGNQSPYAKGWTMTVETARMETKAIVHNKRAPGLAHLLEFGHAIVSGGRVVGEARAIPHIKPVEEKIIKSFEEEIRSRLV